MTREELASEIAKREEKKSSVAIGDIREILRIIVDIEVETALAKDGGEKSPVIMFMKEAGKKIKKGKNEKL